MKKYVLMYLMGNCVFIAHKHEVPEHISFGCCFLDDSDDSDKLFFKGIKEAKKAEVKFIGYCEPKKYFIDKTIRKEVEVKPNSKNPIKLKHGNA